jgi:DNA-binding FadR family transcriptional regulator
MIGSVLDSRVLRYIVDAEPDANGGGAVYRLPPIEELAEKLGLSRGKIREELIAAQASGIVEMRPGDGTYVRRFDFYSTIRRPVLFAALSDYRHFEELYRLRVQLEVGSWEQATSQLTPEDRLGLQRTVERALRKLEGTPVEIPHGEHRSLHLGIYRGLANPFVVGILQVYWDAYEAVGLHRYFDYSYYQKMWESHRELAEAIAAGRYEEGKSVLLSHFTLLDGRLSGGPESHCGADVVLQKDGPPMRRGRVAGG